MEIRFHELAREDYRRQYTYLRKAEVGPKTLQDYIDAIREAKRRIAQNPNTWSRAAGSKTVRRVQILQFRLQVFYVIRA